MTLSQAQPTALEFVPTSNFGGELRLPIGLFQSGIDGEQSKKIFSVIGIYTKLMMFVFFSFNFFVIINFINNEFNYIHLQLFTISQLGF